MEFDTNADSYYDASGLGRIHKRGAVSTICLSVPFPSSKDPHYNIGNRQQTAFSICPAIKKGDSWVLGAEISTKYNLRKQRVEEDYAEVGFDCTFDSEIVKFDCFVNNDCVTLQVVGNGEVGIAFPAFDFDGEMHSQILEQDNKVTVKYSGCICEYEADAIRSMNTEVANRNGIYKCYMATGNKSATLKIRIYQQ